MRVFHIVFFFIFSISIQSQDIANLAFGTTLAIEDVDIEFVKVLEDSRCPKNVNCVRAGKAIVLVNVYVNGNFIEERKLKFYPSGFSNESVNTLFKANGLRIGGLNLMPYPVASSKTHKEDYFLELAIDY
jgi:hypothetical protein